MKWNRFFIAMFVLPMDIYKLLRDNTFAIKLTTLSAIWFTFRDNLGMKGENIYFFTSKSDICFAGPHNLFVGRDCLTDSKCVFLKKKNRKIENKESLICCYKLKRVSCQEKTRFCRSISLRCKTYTISKIFFYFD